MATEVVRIKTREEMVLARISMEFQKLRDKHNLKIFLLLFNPFTLMMKKTSKKKVHKNEQMDIPTAAVNKRQLWKQQRKKVVFAHTIQPSGSQHKWRLAFPTSSSGT